MGRNMNVAAPNIPTPAAESGQGNDFVMESGDTTVQYGTARRQSLSPDALIVEVESRGKADRFRDLGEY
jgi:hypothetical protein